MFFRLMLLNVAKLLCIRPADARRRAHEIFGDSISPNINCWNKRKSKPVNQTLLPGLGTTVLPIVLTHVC